MDRLRGGCGIGPLVVIDADVLGRHRTGDETYVENLLRLLSAIDAGDLRFAAVTRHPELVPEGMEPVRLDTFFQRALSARPKDAARWSTFRVWVL